jgi:hypothetical protein
MCQFAECHFARYHGAMTTFQVTNFLLFTELAEQQQLDQSGFPAGTICH